MTHLLLTGAGFSYNWGGYLAREALDYLLGVTENDDDLRRLNRTYAGEDHATDVLSFAGEGDHLGDVAISWPAVLEQAREHRHPAESELALLCVHGLLHLLGWDHATAAQNRELSRLTVAALDLSGVKLATRRL